jgi:hypothetical protein
MGLIRLPPLLPWLVLLRLDTPSQFPVRILFGLFLGILLLGGQLRCIVLRLSHLPYCLDHRVAEVLVGLQIRFVLFWNRYAPFELEYCQHVHGFVEHLVVWWCRSSYESGKVLVAE